MSPWTATSGSTMTPPAVIAATSSEVVAWELADDGLHLYLISTGSPYVGFAASPTRNKPWKPAAPVASTVSPGMVDIGGRSMFIECRGSGGPTVIFLAGTRMPRMAMRGIEDALLDEGSVRVCDYDRAGEGRSDPPAEPQDDLDVVDDLAVLLDAAEIEPPYVLVGHSLGGDQAWLYADRHPEGVAGFMLDERRLLRARLGRAPRRLVAGRDRRGAGPVRGRTWARSSRRPRPRTTCRTW